MSTARACVVSCWRRMSVLKFFCISSSLAIAAIWIDMRIKFGDFQHIYNHWPDNCTTYPLNGSEDIALFPNRQAVISSGLFFKELEGVVERPVPKMFMFDFNTSEGPIELTVDIDERQFNPHGIGHWVSAEGVYIVYVINHLDDRDTIESFYFNGVERQLQHRDSIEHPLLREMNDIVVVGLDEFYVTIDHYFSNTILKTVESLLRLPFCRVIYINKDSGTVKIAAAGLIYANGIAKSNNERFIYVSNIGAGEILVYQRSGNNALIYTQAIKLRYAVDNIYIDPTNGHMWAAVFPLPLNVLKYIHDRLHPVEGRLFHIAMSEEEEEPFSYTKSQIEEKFETDGTDFGAMTIGVYCNNKLLLGTVGHDLMLCNNVHTRF